MSPLPRPPTGWRRTAALAVAAGLRFYRFALSPFKPPCCRFTPTCSAYALEAVLRFGVIRGGWLALRRLLKCHPFYRGPLWDPPPPAAPAPRTRTPHG
ncbi:MAG: membrane protein insertion efficiency factor YidD [Lentisphaeria bacterium]|jgi:hypothetical protein